MADNAPNELPVVEGVLAGIVGDDPRMWMRGEKNLTDTPKTTDAAPHGWVWLDDDGWEHDPSEQHPHERGHAEYAEMIRPATAEEAISPDFFRCPEIHMSIVGETVTTIPTMDGRWIELHQLDFKQDE